MYNLKKVLALVVAIAMFASMGVLVSAQDFTDEADFGSSADAINLLSDLGLINGYEDGSFKPANTITRAEVAAIMVRMLGLEDSVVKGETVFTDVPADNWASGYVNVAYTQGIIDGMGDGTFAPSAEVTYEQVVKMVMCALGYEPAAVKNGGYPAGYLKMAATSKTGVTKGVSGTVGQAASRATVAKIVYNALEVELMDQDTYSTGINGDDYKVQEGHTVLSDYLELEKIDGVVVNTYLANVNYDKDEDKTVEIVVTKNYQEDATKDSEADYVKNDKYTFVAEGSDAAALLGYTVTAYVGENEDDDDAIFAITAKANKNFVTAVATEDGFDTKRDGGAFAENSKGQPCVYYFKSSSSKSSTEAKLVNTIKGYAGNDDELIEIDNIVINGFLQSQTEDAYKEIALDESILEQVDEVRFLDNNNDGDFEYVFVTKFDATNGLEFQVEEVDVEDLYITGKDGEALDLDDDDKLIEIIKDGQVVGIDAIAENDIVTVLVDEKTVNVLTVYVSSATVEGSVDEVDDDEYTIAGKEYKASGNTDDVLTFDAGDKGIFYLNFEGKIAAQNTENTIKGAEYVYIIDMDMDEGTFGDQTLLIKAVKTNGEIATLDVKSKKVDIYEGTADSDKHEDLTDTEVQSTLDGILDAEHGTLAKIKTNAAGEIIAFYFPGAEDFNAYDTYEEENSKEYSESKGKYGTLALPTTAVVFNYNSDETDLEDAITASTVGGVFENEGNYTFTAYGEDRDSIDCVVTKDADVTFDPEAAVMVVTKTSTTSYEDDETAKITGIMNGQTVSVVVDPDETDDIAIADDLQKGNVIMFSGSSVVKNITVLLNSNEDEIAKASLFEGNKDIVNGMTVTDEKEAEDNVAIYFNQIVEKKTSYFKLGDETYDEEKGDDTPDFVLADDCRYTLVEYTGNKVNITAGKKTDLKKTTDAKPVYAFVKTAEDSIDEVTDIVVFRGAENL